METWYHFSWGNDLQEVEVIKVTDKMLFIEKERWGEKVQERISKHSYYSDYFPTREDAIAFKKNQLEKRVDRARDSLVYEKGVLDKFNQKYLGS